MKTPKLLGFLKSQLLPLPGSNDGFGAFSRDLWILQEYFPAGVDLEGNKNKNRFFREVFPAGILGRSIKCLHLMEEQLGPKKNEGKRKILQPEERKGPGLGKGLGAKP